MNGTSTSTTDHGNWVPWKLICVPGALAVACLTLALLHPAFLVAAFLFLACVVYFSYARYIFSPGGKNLEEPIRDLVLDHLEWNGEGTVLDIGCGNGPLATELARTYANARVVGIDPWNAFWEYSREACEKNAASEGVSDRVRFQRASAVSLPFEDESFDAAISNLVFHNIRDVKDKTRLIKEALRVVKKGGKFCFHDSHVGSGTYGTPGELLQVIRDWGIEKVDFVDTSKAGFIPRALRNPLMVGNIGIIYGTK